MNIKDNKGESSIEELLKVMWQDIIVWEFINRNYHPDAKRAGLLQEIILGAKKKEKKEKEELISKIYLYGSMLKSKDLIARQIFLWLLDMMEEDTWVGNK